MNTYVDFATFCKIIDRIVSDSFTLDENGETKFNPEGVDFQFRLEIVKNYTKLNYKEDMKLTSIVYINLYIQMKLMKLLTQIHK